MNKSFTTVILVLLLITFPAMGQIAVGDSALNFQLPDTSGNSVSLHDFSGDIILLNFFASWCIPCQIEAPQLEDSVWQVYKDQGVTIIGLDFQEPLFPLTNFINQYNLTYPIVRDTAGDVFNNYGMIVFPSNVIINQHGYVVWVEPGFDIPLMKHLIDSLLILAEAPNIATPRKILPQNLELISTYPNPFNNNTKIKFRLKKSGVTQLKIYDIRGSLIHSQSYFLKAGLNEIPVDFAERASGIYVFSLHVDRAIKYGKLLLEK